MVLSSVIVLTLVSSAIAVPHGYGVKGGAVAKAEANAGAVGFGGIGAVPLSIPSGAGYSGSFSKSSSFASSSSSSSSSSFSYSGAGSGGISGTSGNGCSEGCQGNANNDFNVQGSKPLNGLQQYGGANADAKAVAGGLVGSADLKGNTQIPCQDTYCKIENQVKCSSGKCGHTNTPKPEPNCASGNCNTKEDIGSQSAQYGSDNKCTSGQCETGDEQKCPSGQCSPTKDSESNIDDTLRKPKTQINGNQKPLGTGCASGNCYSSTHSNAKPISTNDSPTSSLPDQHEASSGCDSGDCDSFVALSPPAKELRPTYSKIPSKHLATPNLGPICTTPNCNTPDLTSISGSYNLPSSYNVPIHGPYINTDTGNNIPCTSGYCQNTAPADTYKTNNGNTLPIISSYNPANQDKSLFPCSGSNCDINDDGRNKHVHYPSGSLPPQPSTTLPNCASGNCAPYPSVQTNTVTDINIDAQAFNHGHASYPTDNLHAPVIPSCNSPNCAPNPTFQPPSGNLVPPCSTPYCGTQPEYIDHNHKPTVTDIHSTGGFSGPTGTNALFNGMKPTSIIPNQNIPPYTEGFGGPTGTYDINSTPNTQGTFGVKPLGELPTKVTPTYTGSYGGSTAAADANSAANSQHGSFGVKPTGEIPKKGTPVYTGGFGGPIGTYDINSTPNTQGSFGVKPLGELPTKVTPTYTGSYGGLTAAADANSAVNPQHGSFGVISTGEIPKKDTPVYTGGFGGPTGTYDINSTPNTQGSFGVKPLGEHPNKATPTYTGSFGGSTAASHANSAANSQQGSFGVKPTDEIPKKDYTGGFVGPSVTSDINSTPIIQGPFGVKPAGVIPNKDTPTYTGGFGGPTGTSNYTPSAQQGSFALKPNEKNPNLNIDLHTGGYNSVVSSTGVGSVTNNQQGSYSTNPSISVTPSQTSSIDSHGQFGIHSGADGIPSIQSTAASGNGLSIGTTTGTNVGSFGIANSKPSGDVTTTDEKKPVYAGGFGGPAGFLKPNDFSVPKTPVKPNVGVTNSLPCASGNCAIKNDNHASNTAHAITGAAASSEAEAYSGGFGGPPGLLKPYDDGKLHSGGYTASGDQNNSGLYSHGTAITGNFNSPHGKSLGSEGQAQAAAVAGGFSSATNSGNQPNNGCNSGCKSNGGGYSANFGIGGPNVGNIDGLAGAVASAKSVAGADAHSIGVGGSYASASATAHASAGATKGGYGKR